MFQKWRIRRQLSLSSALFQEYLKALPKVGDQSFMDCSFISLDIETDGLDPKQDSVLSLASVLLSGAVIRLSETTYYFVQAEKLQTTKNIEVHGIHPSEMTQGIREKELMEHVLSQLKGKIFIAHNASFDWAFLNQICLRNFGSPFFCPVIDTMRVEQARLERKQFVMNRGSLTLSACRARYGLPMFDEHDARNDAMATAELLLAQVNAMGGYARVKVRDLGVKLKG